MHIKLISLTIVEHQDSLRNRDKQKLGNGPLYFPQFRTSPAYENKKIQLQRVLRHGQTTRTSDTSVRWEEETNRTHKTAGNRQPRSQGFSPARTLGRALINKWELVPITHYRFHHQCLGTNASDNGHPSLKTNSEIKNKFLAIFTCSVAGFKPAFRSKRIRCCLGFVPVTGEKINCT